MGAIDLKDQLLNMYLQGNGLIRHVETCSAFFFIARVYTTKSTVKILAANTHYKYFLKIAEVTHFSVRGTPCTRGLYNPSLGCESAVLRVAYCAALLGLDISLRV
jgi:hypothetical protein